jgi:hypothetical protein
MTLRFSRSGDMEPHIVEHWKMRDAHALALGQLCMSWAVLDSYMDKILGHLLSVEDAKVSAITTSAGDISQRCEIIKRLVVIENPGTAWRDWLIALVNRVSGELAPTRNRYIHDSWHIHDLKLIRVEKRGKVGKSQSRADVQFTYDTEHVTDPIEVEKLRLRVNLVFAMLAFAEMDLRVWRHNGGSLEPHPQYIAASKPNARYRTPQEHDEALRQGPLASELVFD